MVGTQHIQADHYKTLGISVEATQAQVKQAYRKLAKQYHPDGQNAEVSHEKIAQVNAAYEVLGDVAERRRYDAQRRLQQAAEAEANWAERTSRIVNSQNQHRQRRSSQGGETTVEEWLRGVYYPVERLLDKILKPLKAEVRALSGDPFDDELMAAFQAYIEESQRALEKAQAKFKSMPNPAEVAGSAANVYYCLNQLEDALEELSRFTYTYDDSYLHTGQELFRIAAGLKRDAKTQIKAVL